MRFFNREFYRTLAICAGVAAIASFATQGWNLHVINSQPVPGSEPEPDVTWELVEYAVADGEEHAFVLDAGMSIEDCTAQLQYARGLFCEASPNRIVAQ